MGSHAQLGRRQFWRKMNRRHTGESRFGDIARSILLTHILTAEGTRTLKNMSSLSAGSINIQHHSNTLCPDTQHLKHLNSECTCASLVLRYKYRYCSKITPEDRCRAFKPRPVRRRAMLPTNARQQRASLDRTRFPCHTQPKSLDPNSHQPANPPAVMYVVSRRYSLCSWEAIRAG